MKKEYKKNRHWLAFKHSFMGHPTDDCKQTTYGAMCKCGTYLDLSDWY